MKFSYLNTVLALLAMQYISNVRTASHNRLITTLRTTSRLASLEIVGGPSKLNLQYLTGFHFSREGLDLIRKNKSSEMNSVMPSDKKV
jgi:hypothetical protein